VREEFAAYGKRITDVHIKDRMRGGGSVVLGTGDTDFDTFFALLGEVGYDGPLIMQAYRDDEGWRFSRRNSNGCRID
jgi:hexulose-6-phosphate isomerase